jgi:signal transduction histidine kinase
VLGLPGELNQVFLNIVVNAAYAIAAKLGAASREKGTIRISTRAAPPWLEVRIADSGTGIPEAARDHVFNPFFTTKPVGKGTGQGLAISRTVIVEEHSGTLGFETELDRGTTFVIRLPLSQGAGQEEGTP